MNNQGKRKSIRRVAQLILCLLCLGLPVVWYFNSETKEGPTPIPAPDTPTITNAPISIVPQTVAPTTNTPDTPTNLNMPNAPNTPATPTTPKTTDGEKPDSTRGNANKPAPKPTKPSTTEKGGDFLQPPVAPDPVLFFPKDMDWKALGSEDVIHLFPPNMQEGSNIQLECPSIKVPKLSKPKNNGHLPTIAYSIVMHKRPDLLRVWMHLAHDPDNFYMIHVDAKAPDDVYEDVLKLTDEYDNVKINPERYHTTYYGWSVLWNHISNYMRIKEMNEERDYYINIAGMELPIQTRKEIRAFLGDHEPASFVKEYCTISEIRNYWVAWTWAEVKAGLVVVNKEARAVPPGVKLHFGSQYSILHHNIVDWMLEDLRMLHLLYWLRNTKSPEDIFFVTAARNSPFKNSVFIFNNMKYTETDSCCTEFQPSRSTPCSLGVCDMERVDSADDPNVLPYVIERLAAREREEEQTGKVKRIPLVKGQQLDPEYYTINTQ